LRDQRTTGLLPVCLQYTKPLHLSIISKRKQKYTDDKNMMPKEQKGAAEDQKDASINRQYEKRYYRNVRAARKICVWRG
jgi:hypothetical protein